MYVEEAFKRFEEQKWKDGLNVAAAELISWEAKGTRPGRPAVEKQAGNPKKPWGKGPIQGLQQLKQLREATGRGCVTFSNNWYAKKGTLPLCAIY
jgi:hypothetical protein